MELDENLFFECGFAAALWKGMLLECGVGRARVENSMKCFVFKIVFFCIPVCPMR